ncbi:MAG: sigma-E processing peptidase SpoIIGA [Clostridia bacterium]|nr:sigma-E processing peptidase SpoIIGA [Clostridia bacterium]
MLVYIEYVLIDNFFIDYMLLKATFSLTANKVGRFRLIICSFLGAIFALILPLISLPLFIMIPIKVLSGLIMVALSVKGKSIRALYKNFVVFLVLTASLGGAIIGIFSLFNISYSTEISVAIMVLPAFLLVKGIVGVIKHLSKKQKEQKYYYKISLSHLGTSVEGVGFIDTGNALYDGDSPVIVCDKAFILKLIGDNFLRLKLKKITIRTINGKEQNSAFKLDSLLIYCGDKPNIYKNVTVCISKGGVGDGYDVILHPALMEGNYSGNSDFKIKKVS